MLKENIIKSIKIALGVLVAILIARALNMKFDMTLTTIVIVSMLSEKKQSIKLAGTRLLAAIISLALSSFLFTVFGFSLTVYIIYILLFTFLMYRFDTKIALVLNVVLVMQIYSLGYISLPLLLNQFGLMVLGVIVALVFNAFTLDIEGELIGYQDRSQLLFDSIFNNMGNCLINKCKIEVVNEELNQLDKLLAKGKERAYKYMNSYYVQHNNYYVEYFTMRRQQYYYIKEMQEFIQLKFLKKEQVLMLKDFTDNFVHNTNLLNTCQAQMEKLYLIKHHFSDEAELPNTRERLRNRVALHQYLYSLEKFLKVKIHFINKHEKKIKSNIQAD